MVKPGDLVFVRGRSLLSKAIGFVSTGGKFRNFAPSHIAIVAATTSSNILLIEAAFSGIRYTNLDTYKNYTVWIKRVVGSYDIKTSLEWADSKVGTRYDYLQIMGILSRSLLRLFGKRLYRKSKSIRNFLDSKQKFICSEFVGKIFKRLGIILWHGDISHWTPHDLNRSDLLYEVTL